MISIVVCSVSETLRSAFERNAEATVGVDYELIVIDNSVRQLSISKVYNLGAAQARYPYLCFVHEDITFQTQDWGRSLINHFEETGARLIGILGAVIKTRTPSSVLIPWTDLNRQYQTQLYKSGDRDFFFSNPHHEKRSPVCVLDGLFIAATRTAWSETRFSEDYLHGFHGYDIDFSLKNHFLGTNLVVYDILMEHSSLGTFSRNWLDTQRLVTKRWRKRLPASAVPLTRAQIRNAENANRKEFLMFLLQHRYRRRLQLVLLMQMLSSNPACVREHFLIRRVLLGPAVDRFLKSGLKNLARHVSFSAPRSFSR